MATQSAIKSASAGPVLLTAKRDYVLTLTLNRPNVGNSLSLELIETLQQAFDAAAADETVRVIVIAAGGPIFCAGHDLKEGIANNNAEFSKKITTACAKLMQTMVAQPQPVIAKVQGVATAAGCQLVATCDLAVAADTARFATPGVNIGLWCCLPMVPVSRAMAPKHAMQMLLTGKLVDAQAALRFGLVNDVVPAAELDRAVDELAAGIADKSPFTMALGKQAFYRQLDLDLASAYEYAGKAAVRNRLAEDAEEGINAFLEKRKPQWKGR
ncbi:MAG: enoyl-CoA hydratase [Betaproteobacteria bacterium]|nr:enoyl-CoA hydratase [Betaproteobacteria bacterium]